MRYRCTIMRGGTSKGVFLAAQDLPRDAPARERVILRIFGSPDRRQIDGLGGAEFLTSKVAIIGPPSRPDADVDYTFGQVGISEPRIEYGNCGNISAAVGPYAIEEGIVEATGALTTVRIHSVAMQRILLAHVPTQDGRPVYAGGFAIDGVPGTGARMAIDYSDAAGSLGRGLLPTGRVRDILHVPGLGDLEVSFVDCSNPAVILRMEALGLGGDESIAALEADPSILRRVEAIRMHAARSLGIPWDEGADANYMPMLIAVREPLDYQSFADGERIAAGDIDFAARGWANGTLHKAFGGTTGVCVSAAARVPGTVLWNAIAPERREKSEVVIGHPSGRMFNESEIEARADGQWSVKKAVMYRTARRIMDGFVYVD
jgi:methylitaconate Delta-isomerase